MPFTFDPTNDLRVTGPAATGGAIPITGSITATNPSVGLNAAGAPTSSTEIGFIDGSGNLQGVSALEPLPVTGTFIASNPSVSGTGVAAPAFATEIGWVNGSGNLVDVSAATPLPVSGSFTSSGSLSNNTAAPIADNVGVLPAIANAASPTWTEGNQVLESVDLSGRQRTRGTLTNNTAAPTNDHGSQLNYVANAVAPTWTEGNAVLGSVDLNGNTRIIGTKFNNSAAPTTELGVTPAIANASAPTWTEGNQVLLSVDLHGNQRVITGTGSTTAVTGNVTVVQPTGTNLHVVVDSLPLTTSTSGTLTNNNAAPAANNIGVLPALANAANPLWTEGDQVLLSEDLSGNLRVKVNAPLPAGTNVIGHVITDTGSTTAVTGTVTVVQPVGSALHVVVDSGTNPIAGNLSNNNAAPVATNVGVLPALANASNPSWTEGNQVLLSEDLSGNLRVKVNAPLPAGTNVIGHVITDSGSTTVVTGSVAVTGTFFQATQPVSGTVTANQGAANTAANSWPVEVTDGTNVLFTAGHPGFVSGSFSIVGALTNNSAAPAATNLGVLPAIAETAYTTITYTTGNQVLPVTDLHGALNQDLQAVAGVALGATAVTNFGTAPAAAAVPGVNSSIFAGATGLTATGSSLNVNITGGASSTVAGSLTNNNAAPAANNMGVLPALANAASPSWTEGDQVLLSVDLTGRNRTRGTLTHNTAAPTSDGIMVLNHIANAVAPTFTEGDLVLASSDLNGNTRVIGTKTNNTAAPTTEVAVIPALANASNPAWTEGNQVLLSTDLVGNLRVRVLGVSLTNNNAAPGVNNIGVLPAVANAAAPTWTEGDQVLLSETLGGLLRTTGGGVAQSSTTSGELGTLTQGAVTTAAPTYTTGQTNPISLTTAGAQRMDLSSLVGTTLGAPSNYGTSPGAVEVLGVNAFVTNTVATTLTSTTITGTVAVDGALTNNTAAPIATLIGVLPAIAETAWNTATYTTGNQVLPTTDIHGALWNDLGAVAAVQLGATAVVAYGSTPAAVNVPAVNAAVTNTVLTNLAEVASSFVSTAASGVQLVGIEGHAGGVFDGVITAATAPANMIVTGGVYNSTAPTLTTGQSASLQLSSSGALIVSSTASGSKTNNNAAPGATNVGVLPGIANAAVQTWTEGDQVLESMTLTGAQRVTNLPTTVGGLLTVSGTIGATATAIKASAGQLYGWWLFNNNATIVYCQIFNTASGSVTLGTTAPTLSFGIPIGSAANILSSMGIAFGTAISFAFTTTRSGSTAPAVTCDYNFFYF